MDVEDPQYADVAGVLLDPSCSGSGTSASRMDYLLPSHQEKGAEPDEVCPKPLKEATCFRQKGYDSYQSCVHL